MLCSTIIPTIGRASLAAAVESVLSQGFDPADHEVIVVNDSGKPLPEAAWMQSKNVSVLHTNRRNRSVARNAGAAASSGKYLHFLDDDDWMMPGAFDALLQGAETRQAGWSYGAFRLVNNDGATVTEIYPDEEGNCSIQMLAWEWLPLQASFIRSDAFFAVDGFASLPSLGGGFEDVHLSRQIALAYDMARSDRIVTSIRAGDVGSTTNYVTMFDQNRRSREKSLSADGAFRRLASSARSHRARPGYWYGKVIYYYLASMKWHLKNRHLITAASRGSRAAAGLAGAGRFLLAPDFWKGVIKPHYPRMGRALQEAGADHLYADTRRAITRF